jgi:hypothetical protein
MIILINGAFGIGKTTVAKCLASKLDNSLIFDPEVAGTFVRKITNPVRTGTENTDDYQDIELWRTLTVHVAGELHKKYGRHLIIPMTIANLDYFREIKEGFGRIDPTLHHFCLTGSAFTIYKRLLKRGTIIGSWPFRQTARCLEAFQSPEFAIHIDTEKASPQRVTKTIQDYLGTI